jgi:hypothetical protein
MLVFPDASQIERDNVGGLKASVDRRWGGPLNENAAERTEGGVPRQAASASFLGRVAAGDANAVVTGTEEREEVFEGKEEDTDDEGVIVWSAIETVEAREVDGLAVTRAKAKLEEQKAAEKVMKAEEKGKNVEEKQPGKARDDRTCELPAYRYESKAADAEAPKKMYQRMVEAVVPNVTNAHSNAGDGHSILRCP